MVVNEIYHSVLVILEINNAILPVIATAISDSEDGPGGFHHVGTNLKHLGLLPTRSEQHEVLLFGNI